MAANRIAIRAIRRDKNIGLRTLAQKTGRNRGFLSQLENGERGASETTLQLIAEALEVPIEAITLPDPEPVP